MVSLGPESEKCDPFILSTQTLQKLTYYFSLLCSIDPQITLLLKLKILVNHSNSLTMLYAKKELEGNAELNLQSPRRSQQQLQDFEGSAEFNLVSPQRSPKKMQFPRLSFSSQRTKNEQHAHPPLPSPSVEKRSSFKEAMKTLVSPVKKAGNMLSDSFRDLNPPKVNEEEEGEEGEAEELKKENNDLTLMLLCRELELLSD
jgi:hypothetical protein